MIQTCEKSSKFWSEYSTLLNLSEISSMSMIPLESGDTVGWRGLPFLVTWHDRTNPIGRKEKGAFTSSESQLLIPHSSFVTLLRLSIRFFVSGWTCCVVVRSVRSWTCFSVVWTAESFCSKESTSFFCWNFRAPICFLKLKKENIIHSSFTSHYNHCYAHKCLKVKLNI